MATTNQIVNNVYTYGLRGMERKIRTGVPHTKFLQEHFFGGEGGILTNQRFIKLKIQKKGRRSATQAEWNTKGNILANDNGYKYVIVEIPYFFDRHVITPDELDQLDFEEDPANPLSYDQKLLLVMQNDREDLYEIHDTAKELLAFEVLSTGGYALKDGSNMDYGISSSMFEDGDTASYGKLSAATNKLKWLQARCKEVLVDSGVLVNEILLGDSVVADLLDDTTIQRLLDLRRVEGGSLDFEKYREDGVTFHGYIKIPGFGSVALLSYVGRYTKDDGTEDYIFPENSILFGHRNLGNTNYGAVYTNTNGVKLPLKTAMKDFVHVVEGDGDIPSNMAVCKQTSPCFAPMVIGGWKYIADAV